MRIALFWLPLLLLAAADPPGSKAPGRTTLAADTEDRWVPFDLTPGNQIRFDMTVDGKTLVAILDTGVSYSVMSQRYADAAKVKTRPGGSATAIGGAVNIAWADTQSVSLGGLSRSGGGFTVTALPAIATGSAVPVDLLVGRDMIGGYALDIDYAAKRLRVLRSGRLPFTGASAPLSIARDRLVYVSELTLGGARLRPMVVDTGDGSAITLSAASWRAAGPPAVPTTTAISFGLAGVVTSTIGVVPELRTGDLTAKNVEIRIEPAGGFSETIDVAGRIGSGFLQNYRVLLDPAAGHMVLRAGPDADKPPLRSTSGLLVGLDKDRLRVLHVMRGGPAAAAGWKNGDTICTIDGSAVPKDYVTNPLANWSAGTPGRVVTLGACDGTTRTLTLRQFY